MTDRKVFCPACRIGLTTGEERDNCEEKDMLGDWDCESCGTSFSITKFGKHLDAYWR